MSHNFNWKPFTLHQDATSGREHLRVRPEDAEERGEELYDVPTGLLPQEPSLREEDESIDQVGSFRCHFMDYGHCSVWPEAGVKSSPNVSKSCLKSSKSSFYIRVRFFKIAPKVANHLGYFCWNFVAKNFKKSPNLVTLFGGGLIRLMTSLIEEVHCSTNMTKILFRTAS